MKILTGLITKPMKAVEIATKLAIVYGIFMALSIVKDITSSGFDGDFQLWGRDEQGHTRIGHISASKTLPHKTPMNILSYKHSTNGLQSIEYGRHVFMLGSWNVYGVAGIGAKPDEVIGSVGVTITF